MHKRMMDIALFQINRAKEISFLSCPRGRERPCYAY